MFKVHAYVSYRNTTQYFLFYYAQNRYNMKS